MSCGCLHGLISHPYLHFFSTNLLNEPIPSGWKSLLSSGAPQYLTTLIQSSLSPRILPSFLPFPQFQNFRAVKITSARRTYLQRKIKKMSRFWPHTPYDDQPLATTILTTHVLTRGFKTGTIFGLAVTPPLYHFCRTSLITKNFPKLSLPTPKTPISLLSLAPNLLATAMIRGAGTGALVMTLGMCIALPMQMKGKEEIDWKDGVGGYWRVNLR